MSCGCLDWAISMQRRTKPFSIGQLRRSACRYLSGSSELRKPSRSWRQGSGSSSRSGPREYWTVDGQRMQVFASPMPQGARPDGYAALAEVPFIAQRRIHPRSHFRVVTVLSQAWVGQLDPPDELDWRKDGQAHDSFSPTYPDHPAVRPLIDDALLLADTLRLGYTSQDWIWDGDKSWFVDVNPSGQWLFLPEPIRGDVARALAIWMSNA